MDFINKEKPYILLDAILSKNYNALLDWRKQCPRKEYPSLVIKKIFCDFYTDEQLWPIIVTIFASGAYPLVRDYEHAQDILFGKRKDIKNQKIKPILDELLNNDVPVVTNMHFSEHSNIIESAANGNDTDLEKIEYYFIFYKMTSDLISFWAAAGIYGKNSTDAMSYVAGSLVGIGKGSFEDIFNAFKMITGLYLSGGTTTGKMFGKYKALPPFK